MSSYIWVLNPDVHNVYIKSLLCLKLSLSIEVWRGHFVCGGWGWEGRYCLVGIQQPGECGWRQRRILNVQHDAVCLFLPLCRLTHPENQTWIIPGAIKMTCFPKSIWLTVEVPVEDAALWKHGLPNHQSELANEGISITIFMFGNPCVILWGKGGKTLNYDWYENTVGCEWMQFM